MGKKSNHSHGLPKFSHQPTPVSHPRAKRNKSYVTGDIEKKEFKSMEEKVERKLKQAAIKDSGHQEIQQLKDAIVQELSHEIKKRIKKEFNKLYGELKRGNGIELNLAELISRNPDHGLQSILSGYPLQLNLHLNLNQTQNPEQISIGHVDHSAVAVKHSNAVDDPVNSAVAQDHSNAADDPTNSSIAQGESQSSNDPANSSVAQKKSHSADDTSGSAIAQAESQSSDNPSNSSAVFNKKHLK